MTAPTPLADRLFSKVRKTKSCWIFLGYRNSRGYGQIGRGPSGTSPVRAHVASWEIHNGAVPDGLYVLHRCDNPPCVNPKHLFLGTHADNMADMVAKGRVARNERSGRCRISNEAVRLIREEFARGGVTQTSLAKKYSASVSHICQIINLKARRGP